MDKEYTQLSKFISLILRHKPEIINIQLDEHGWCNIEELIEKINAHGKYISMDILEEIVSKDNKQRYTFNEDSTKIRANQGHSIDVDVEIKEEVPPEFLYHGTVERFIDSIKAMGLKKMQRQHVHLSAEMETAKVVAERRGSPRILRICSAKMYKDGYKFYKSKNNVWLTEAVPEEYIVF